MKKLRIFMMALFAIAITAVSFAGTPDENRFKMSLDEIETSEISVDVDHVLLYLNKVESSLREGVTIDDAINELGDKSKDFELYVAYLIQVDAQNIVEEEYTETEEVIDGTRTMYLKRLVCYAIGIAKWTNCDANCENCSGTTWAGCNSYTISCY